MLRIGLNGANGRMGQEIQQLISVCPEKYILCFARSRSCLQLTLGLISELPASSDAQVLIDFSTPAATLELASWCQARHIPLVIGTTGFSPAQLQILRNYAKSIPLLVSPNMSLSVNVLFKVAALVAKKLPRFDVEIIESHHRFKKDAPSGTALQIGQEIASARGQDFNQVAKYDRVGAHNQVRSTAEIGFAVVRGGDVVGKHTVALLGAGEELNLTSEVTNRRSFAHGALLAAEFLALCAKPGWYGMDDVLGLMDL